MPASPGVNQPCEVYTSQVTARSGLSRTEVMTVPITEITSPLGYIPDTWVAYMPYYSLECLTDLIRTQQAKISKGSSGVRARNT